MYDNISQVSTYGDCLKLQNDLSNVFQWSIKWQLTLNPANCESIKISNKRSPVNIDGLHPVSWSQKVKYLVIIINLKLKWNDQYQYIINEATKCLNRLRLTMSGCTQEDIVRHKQRHS